jgi:hypothetical protein
MDNKNIIIILSVIVVILLICTGYMYLNSMNNKQIEYEKYTVNGTKTTLEIPINSKIVENDELVNITNDDNIQILIYKNTTKSKSSNDTNMGEKLNKKTKELVQVYSDNENVIHHIIKSIDFGKVVKTEKTESTKTTTSEVDHSKDPVYCSLCGAYVATQYEIDHAPGAGYFIDPSTGKTICDNCAAKLMEAEDEKNNDFGEQDDGSYIDADGNQWQSYDEYLYFYNS